MLVSRSFLLSPRVAFAACVIVLGGAGCARAPFPVARAPVTPMAPASDPPIAVRAPAAEPARTSSNLLYPYNLPQYRDDVTAALATPAQSPSPNALPR
jgi:hypothetical protein